MNYKGTGLSRSHYRLINDLKKQRRNRWENDSINENTKDNEELKKEERKKTIFKLNKPLVNNYIESMEDNKKEERRVVAIYASKMGHCYYKYK